MVTAAVAGQPVSCRRHRGTECPAARWSAGVIFLCRANSMARVLLWLAALDVGRDEGRYHRSAGGACCFLRNCSLGAAARLSMRVVLPKLQAVNAKQTKALARKTEEHACAMRCLQKFAVNNRLLGQMMVRKKTRHPPILVELDD